MNRDEKCFYGGSQLDRNLMAICTLCEKTDEDISNACNVPVSVITEWRNGRCGIPANSVCKISKLLGISISSIIDRMPQNW